MLILQVHKCFSFPLKRCKEGFQCVGGRSGFTHSLLSLCRRRATARNHPGYWLLDIGLRASQSPSLSHLSLPVLCQFQHWGMPWGWNRLKIQMNQCLISQVLCLQARQSNYYLTWVPCWFSRTNRRRQSITALSFKMHFELQWLFYTGIVHLDLMSFFSIISRLMICTKGMKKKRNWDSGVKIKTEIEM